MSRRKSSESQIVERLRTFAVFAQLFLSEAQWRQTTAEIVRHVIPAQNDAAQVVIREISLRGAVQ